MLRALSALIKPLGVSLTLLLASGGAVAHPQSPCPPADSAVTAWLQSMLTADYASESREILGLNHLEGQQIRVLGSRPEDHVVCQTLFDRLLPEVRALFDDPSEWRVMYYQVGDRYLQYQAPQFLLGRAFIRSVDLQLNKLGDLAP